MNGKHSSGALVVEQAAGDGVSMLVTDLPAIIARVIDADDARRLAACWNACKGLKIEEAQSLAAMLERTSVRCAKMADLLEEVLPIIERRYNAAHVGEMTDYLLISKIKEALKGGAA